MAITPRLFSLGDSVERRLTAPRSLKEAVNCWFSNLSQTLLPTISDSVRLQLQSVWTMASAIVRCAASMSSSVTAGALAGDAEALIDLRSAMTFSRASAVNLGGRA